MLTKSSLLLLLAASVLAWGGDGHQLVGEVAAKLLQPGVQQRLDVLIADRKGSLASASTWADEIKRQSGYAGWSGPLHYIDAKNAPPKSCDVDYKRDCPDGKCIVGAIANYTTRLKCTYNTAQRGEAVKFLTHFVGDLTQPLHTCDRARGGNDVQAVFSSGKDTTTGSAETPAGNTTSATPPPKRTSSATSNLHSVWDTKIVQKRLRAFGNSHDNYVAHLLKLAKSDYEKQVVTWTSCIVPQNDAELVDGVMDPTMLSCSMAWTSDTSDTNCDLVWKLYDQNPKQDLAGAYFEAAIPFLDRQILKGGVRLAKLLNTRLGDCRDDKQPEEPKTPEQPKEPEQPEQPKEPEQPKVPIVAKPKRCPRGFYRNRVTGKCQRVHLQQ